MIEESCEQNRGGPVIPTPVCAYGAVQYIVVTTAIRIHGDVFMVTNTLREARGYSYVDLSNSCVVALNYVKCKYRHFYDDEKKNYFRPNTFSPE